MYNNTHWTLSSSSSFAGSGGQVTAVGDPAGVLDTLTFTGEQASNGFLEKLIIFDLTTTSGTRTASFSIRDQSGVFSGVYSQTL